MALISKPNPAISAAKAKPPWPSSGGKRYMHTCWYFSTRELERFCAGSRLYRRICFCCRAPCGRRNDAGWFEKCWHDKELYQPHGDVTPVILPKILRFGVCCTCVEYPTRNIAARPALTQRPSAWPAAIGGLNHWRALEWPEQPRCRFSLENPACLDP